MLTWLIALAAFLLLAPLTVWLGRAFGRKAGRAFPGAALALMMLQGFFRIDPPPPPKAERVHKDEEDAGDPPVV